MLIYQDTLKETSDIVSGEIDILLLLAITHFDNVWLCLL